MGLSFSSHLLPFGDEVSVCEPFIEAVFIQFCDREREGRKEVGGEEGGVSSRGDR